MQDRNGKVIDTNSKKFLWKQRIGFGISDFACNIAYIMVNTYLLIFYTAVAGLATGSGGAWLPRFLMHLLITWSEDI